MESRRIRTHVCPSASTGAARENTNVSVVETMPKEAGEAGVLLRKVSDSKMIYSQFLPHRIFKILN